MKHLHPFHLPIRLPLSALLFFIVRCGAQELGPVAAPGPLNSPAAGNAYAPGPFGSSSEDRPKSNRTVIDSDAGATFDNATRTAEFTGAVVVHDPQFDLSCDKLHVILGANRKGLSKVIATGSVVITQEKKNDRGDLVKSVGKCGRATYDATTGDVTMEDWPQIQQGINNQVATQQSTVMILNAKGRSRTIGGSRTMIVDQGTNSAVTP